MAERKTCSNKGCEKKFTAKTNNQIYCSTQCNKKAYYKRNQTHQRSLRESY